MNQIPLAGNYFNKYDSTNPLIQCMVNGLVKHIQGVVRSVSAQSILDIGCGEGFLLESIQSVAASAVRVVGTDISAGILSEARRRMPSLEIFCCSVYSLPVIENAYDLVLACEVLEHLESPRKALQEIHRVAASSVLMTVPLEPWWCVANMVRGRYLARWGNTPGHIQKWNARAFKSLVSDYFTIIEYKRVFLWQSIYAHKRRDV